MRKLKKAFSLTLAFALSLALAAPAFAVESEWKLEVPGKSSTAIFVGKKTFTLRDCGMYDYDGKWYGFSKKYFLCSMFVGIRNR